MRWGRRACVAAGTCALRQAQQPDEQYAAVEDGVGARSRWTPTFYRFCSYPGLRCAKHGAIEVEIRLAIGLRMLAGGSYLDIASKFGVSQSTVFTIMWEVVGAINNTHEVRPFFFPQTDEACRFFAAGFEVRVRVLLIQQQPVTTAVVYGEDMKAVRKRVESMNFSEGRPAYIS